MGPYRRGHNRFQAWLGGVGQFLTLSSSKIEITSHRWLDQSQAGIHRGKCPIPPHFGPVHNMLLQFFTLDSSKIEVFETYFFDTMITLND